MRSLMLALAVLTSILLVSPGVEAWWCDGHMLIAEVARLNLDPDVETKVQAIFKGLQAQEFPLSPDMTQGACWADDIKRNLPAMEGWHYDNMVYNPSHYAPIHVPGDSVIVSVLHKLTVTLRAIHSHWHHGPRPNVWEKTFALANVVHLVGDLHQPLHVTNYFSRRFPQGDSGGNLFYVYFNGKLMPLHAVWDSVCGKYMIQLQRPLSQQDAQNITKHALTLMQQYTFSPAMKSLSNVTAMAEESFRSAITYSYADLTPGDTLSASYVANCLHEAEQRLTLAGYRLASLLNGLFRDTASFPRHRSRAL